jgi:hypothetical protein
VQIILHSGSKNNIIGMACATFKAAPVIPSTVTAGTPASASGQTANAPAGTVGPVGGSGIGNGGSNSQGQLNGAGINGGVATPLNNSVGDICTSSTGVPQAPVTGYHIVKCQDFNGTFLPEAFQPFIGGGAGRVVGGGRKASQCTVAGGILTLTQNTDGSTCGIDSNFSQKYGFWEVRMRAYSTGTSGSAPHPVLMTYPDSGKWPLDGENDYLETDIGDPQVEAFLHCPTSSGGNCYTTNKAIDLTQWHTYGFEWTPTSMTGFIDGEKWYTTNGINPPGPMHQIILLDNLSGKTPARPGKMEVDWAHMFSK